MSSPRPPGRLALSKRCEARTPCQTEAVGVAEDRLGGSFPERVRRLLLPGDGRFDVDGQLWVAWPPANRLENLAAWSKRGLGVASRHWRRRYGVMRSASIHQEPRIVSSGGRGSTLMWRGTRGPARSSAGSGYPRHNAAPDRPRTLGAAGRKHEIIGLRHPGSGCAGESGEQNAVNLAPKFWRNDRSGGGDGAKEQLSTSPVVMDGFPLPAF